MNSERFARKSSVASYAAAALLTLVAACRGDSGDGKAPAGAVEVAYDTETGRFDLFGSDHSGGKVCVRGARAEVWFSSEDGGGIRTASTTDDFTRSLSTEAVSGVHGKGKGKAIVAKHAGLEDAPGLELRFSRYDGARFVLLELRALNDTPKPVKVHRIRPLVAKADQGGALFVGADPAAHRVLDNGAAGAFDFHSNLLAGDQAMPSDMKIAAGLFGQKEGNIIANYNAVIYDPASGRSVLAGFLSFERSPGFVDLSYEKDKAPADEPDGRKGFTLFILDNPMLRNGSYPIMLQPGEALDSEVAYVDLAAATPFDGLETYADALAASLGVNLWRERNPDATSPNGWNSWGGYGHEINEEIILRNLDFAARELRDFGMDFFQIDDGWQDRGIYGNWEKAWDERFPRGLGPVAEAIAEKGFLPGLWIAPFSFDERSHWFSEHPDWFSGEYGGTQLPDFTNSEVRDWIKDVFARVRGWGFRWLKVDFAYWSLFGSSYEDGDATGFSAYRLGLGAIREAAGGDTFMLNVAALGASYGFSDSMRLTLDNMPSWEGNESQKPHMRQGLKPTARSAARRYYLHDRVWVNHPDLIFFRHNDKQPDPPELTFNESRCFCSFVGLSGGVVKMGERLVEMSPEEIDVVRRLLPSYGRAARPLDLFEREFPEVYDLKAEGAGESYEVLGFVNWGKNIDLTVNPFQEAGEGAKTYTVRFEDLGLAPGTEYLAFEFWDGEFLGRVKDSISVAVEPRREKVVALREASGAPQFIGWNRQIVMGAVGVEKLEWDEARLTLSGRHEAAAGTELAPFAYRLYFFVPDGYTFDNFDIEGLRFKDAGANQEGEVLTFYFTAEEKGEAAWTLKFRR